MSAEASAKTLWMGDLAYWMDESFIYSVFVGAQPKTSRSPWGMRCRPALVAWPGHPCMHGPGRVLLAHAFVWPPAGWPMPAAGYLVNLYCSRNNRTRPACLLPMDGPSDLQGPVSW